MFRHHVSSSASCFEATKANHREGEAGCLDSGVLVTIQADAPTIHAFPSTIHVDAVAEVLSAACSLRPLTVHRMSIRSYKRVFISFFIIIESSDLRIFFFSLSEAAFVQTCFDNLFSKLAQSRAVH